MKIVEMAILSTDLASYFEKRERFLTTADAGEIDWQVQFGLYRTFTIFSSDIPLEC